MVVAMMLRGGMGGLRGGLAGRVTLGSLGVTTAYDFGGRGGTPSSACPGEEHCSYRWNCSDDDDDTEEKEEEEAGDGETVDGDMGEGETGDGFRSPVCRLGVRCRLRGRGRTGTGTEAASVGLG